KLLGDHQPGRAWQRRAADAAAAYWDEADRRAVPRTDRSLPTYAQVVGAVNRHASAADAVVAAAGGLPGEINAGWRSKGVATFDCEYGFSCMGYELSGGWGAAMAMSKRAPADLTIVFAGDGSYLMLNSDLYSSVLSGHKMVVVLCDNGG